MTWFVLAALFCLLAMHPFITYPISLHVAARLHGRSRMPGSGVGHVQPVAILVCAYNEAAVIGDKMRNCLSLQSANPGTQILVYTDGCSDRTAEIVREAGAGDRIHLIEGRERRGKSFGMNQLVRAARANDAELLFFTDANVAIDDNAIRAMRAAFADPAVGCLTGHLDYVNPSDSATAMVGARYWSADEALKALETRSGSCMGADGSIFGIRAHLFHDVPENIMDDFYTSMSVLCDGWRCIYSPDVIAYERSATLSGEEYRRKVRIACRAFNCHRQLWPRLRRLDAWNLYKYVSHKVLRWLTALWLGCAAVTACVGVVASTFQWEWRLGFVVLLLGGSAVVAQAPGAPWSYARQVLIAITATGIGVMKSLQGERFQTWSAAGTTRQMPLQPTSE